MFLPGSSGHFSRSVTVVAAKLTDAPRRRLNTKSAIERACRLLYRDIGRLGSPEQLDDPANLLSKD
jgi:hypothetical protein